LSQTRLLLKQLRAPTCSDTAVAVTVIRLLDDDLAVVHTEGGDTILVHASEAIAVPGAER
jgi:hydrogenase expression/formation protein HypC